MRQIVALGGGGFSTELDNTLIDDYVLRVAGEQRPHVCFLPTASGDAPGYIEKFYSAFSSPRAEPSHVSLFHGPAADPRPESLRTMADDLRGHLLCQHVIYVGGGNSVAMLAVWRAFGIDVVLREAYERGVVVCGISAGSLCWFTSGTTDSYGRGMQAFDGGLGLLPASHSPHYDSEPGRRPTYQAMIASGRLAPGYAADDGAALHFVDGALARVVASRPNARGYHVTRDGDAAVERPLPTQLLRADSPGGFGV